MFGPAYSGIALDVIGLPTGVEPGDVSPEVLDALIYAAGLGFIPTLCLAIWMALRIDMRREKVEQVQAALRERRENAAAVARAGTLSHNPRLTS